VINRPTKEQRKRWALIVELGCIICQSPAEIHHCLITAGCRKNHNLVIPLCPEHHRLGQYGIAIHEGKTWWESIYGTEQFLLNKVSMLVDL